MAKELMAIVGDRQAAWMTLEKLDAEVGFKLLERLRDRRLRDRKVLRGARYRALLGDGNEVLDLAKREGHQPLEHGREDIGKHRESLDLFWC